MTVSIRSELLKTKSAILERFDPEVDGVLPICIEKVTKVVENSRIKFIKYRNYIRFSTETEDAHGEIVASSPIENPFSIPEIDEMCKALIGEITRFQFLMALRLKRRTKNEPRRSLCSSCHGRR